MPTKDPAKAKHRTALPARTVANSSTPKRAKRQVTKATTSSKRAAKRVTNSDSLQKDIAHSSAKDQAKDKAKAVTLPNNMSLRAIERSYVLRSEFDEALQAAMYKIAVVSGLCFVLVGSSFAASTMLADDLQLQAQSIGFIDAQYPIASDTNTLTTTDSSTAVMPVSEFSFLTKPPRNIIEPTRVTFSATYVDGVSANLVTSDGGGYFKLTVAQLDEETYEVKIPGPQEFQRGYYELRVYVKPLDGSGTNVKKTPEFFIGSPEEERIYNDLLSSGSKSTDDSTSTTDSSTTDDSNTTTKETTTDLDTSGSNSTTDSTSGSTNTSETDGSKTDTASSDDDTKETTKETETTTAKEFESEQESVEITDDILETGSKDDDNDALPVTIEFGPLQSTVLKGNVALSVVAPKDLRFIELYARPINATEPRFVTLAIKRLERWVFAFDSQNIPNGDYEFFAKTVFNNKTVLSRSIRITVKNEPVTKPPLVSIADSSSYERPVLTTQETVFEPTITLSDDVQKETNSIISANKETFDELLQHYAAAQQTGDEAVVRLADEALQQKRQAIMLESTNNDRVRDISDKIDLELAEQIEELKSRIATFEALRRERSGGETAIDTDGDGISDVDEVTLYGTDPGNPDTDNDGFTDYAEIMRGYDPTDPTPEVPVRFESPKETVGLVRGDVLVIDDVLPIVDDTAGDGLVTAEIRGRALPNSFVTLYIFSMPTVVTIKIDADGMFVYTYSKELEDGEHDVYVAVTDNAGKILAQSQAFSFVKQAQAFTPVAAADSAIVSPETTITTDRSGYRLAGAVGILAFGAILLLLGMNLRKREDDGVVVTEHAVDGSSPN